MKKRNIALMILFTLITAGIYSLYWYCSFQNSLKRGTGKGFSGATHLIVSIVSLGIYHIYWQYAAGKRLAALGAQDNAVLYLVLTFLTLGLINPFLMQNQANKLRLK